MHTSMAEAEGLVNAVDELLDSPGGEILSSFQRYLRKRFKILGLVFAFAFMVTFPVTKNVIAWLIEPNRLPADVDIIVITPVEFILLQVQLAAQVGLLCMVVVFLCEGSWQASKNLAFRQRLAELKVHSPRPNKTFVVTLLFAVILLGSGVYYAWNWLIPMLLEYLTTDAQTAGLSTEWRLTSYIGVYRQFSNCICNRIPSTTGDSTGLANENCSSHDGTFVSKTHLVWCFFTGSIPFAP